LRVNLHAHTFFSYSGYGYSPTGFAVEAKKQGLYAGGIVDFDVLDGVDEFLDACRLLELRGCAGLETRVYIPELADKEINSPGEPGISYHMGAGFTRSSVGAHPLLERLRNTSEERNRGIISRVNAHLSPVELDYGRDVLPLTPNGNATERHICEAYEQKARDVYPDETERTRFWADRLGCTEEIVKVSSESPPDFQGLIRKTTMKKGGVGYVQPDGPSFPQLKEVNAFVMEAGAIPTATWLDGTSAGEGAVNELVAIHRTAGSAALNIIPDRNWNIKEPEVRERKVANLHAIVEAANAAGWPVIVGTEMNAYGQRFVDDFDAEAMRPVAPTFIRGARILYAHTRLEAIAGMGYMSDWSREQFDSVDAKNDFFEHIGVALEPGVVLDGKAVAPDMSADELLALVKA